MGLLWLGGEPGKQGVSVGFLWEGTWYFHSVSLFFMHSRFLGPAA